LRIVRLHADTLERVAEIYDEMLVREGVEGHDRP
jgi:hypothetical protein